VAIDTLVDLRARHRGPIIGPGDALYDPARITFNGMVDRRPHVIARPLDVDDVAAAVAYAVEADLPIAVRGGGHSVAGHCIGEGSVVIDLRLQRSVTVDPDARTATCGGGALWEDLDPPCLRHGLATPGGTFGDTGVAGLTLGGGIGWIMRRHGLSVDMLRRVDLVTADGELVKASADENEELFWGVRGAGANFGIVTEFEFDLAPVGPTILAGPIFWKMEDSPEVLRFYRDWAGNAPDELMSIVIHRKAPPLPFVPEELHGQPVVMVIPCWVGDLEEGEKFIKPMREFGNAVADVCTQKPYLAHQSMFDPSFVPGRWYYFRAFDVPELTDEMIDITVDYSLRIKSPLTSFPIWQMGGAVSRVGENDTAFGGRQAAFTYNIGCSTENAEGFDEERQWVRDFYSALEEWQTSVYVNFLSGEEEGEARVRAAYGEAKYDRLKALKRKWDPDNYFRINQNISPD
jgi:FAD/FMN-containing dehydrogenase